MRSVDRDLEDRLAELRAPAPDVHPWALVDPTGVPVRTELSNGQSFAATYRTEAGARRGRSRWGGTVIRRAAAASNQ